VENTTNFKRKRGVRGKEKHQKEGGADEYNQTTGIERRGPPRDFEGQKSGSIDSEKKRQKEGRKKKEDRVKGERGGDAILAGGRQTPG